MWIEHVVKLQGIPVASVPDLNLLDAKFTRLTLGRATSSNVLINRLRGTHLFPDRQTCQQASLVPVSMYLTQVLVGREEAYHPSRDHIAQVAENAACLLHLQKAKS